MRADVAVIGGGPAGATAAVSCARAGARTILFEPAAVGGETVNVEELERGPEGSTVPGVDVATALLEQVLAEDLDLRLGEGADAVERTAGAWRVVGSATAAGGLEAGAVVLATGAAPKALPGRPPVEEDPLFGSGLFVCASCDGPLYRARSVAVAGGGDTGAGAALIVSRYASRVVLYEREPRLGARPDLVDRLAAAGNVDVRLGTEVVEALGGAALEAVRVCSAGTSAVEPADGLMLAVGLRPRSDLVAGVLDLEEDGAIAVGRALAASAPGAFAAGDVRAGARYRYEAAVEDGRLAAAGALAALGA